MTPADAAPTPEPPLDRGISPIAGTGRGRWSKALAVGGLVVGCAAFAGLGLKDDGAAADPTPTQPAKQIVAFERASPTATLDRPGPGAPALGPIVPGTQVPALDPGTPPVTAGSGRSELATIRRAPLLAYSRRGEPVERPTQAIRASVQDPDAPVRARRLGDRNYLILAGASLPCILQTAMDSTTPGQVSCVIPVDVYSDNGAVVLLEKGTRVLGEYRGGLKQGQRRLHVLWTRAVTPAGVAVQLASPAADALGRAGFDGQVDRHFWDRFGAALLLSVIDASVSGISAPDARHDVVRGPSDAATASIEAGRDIAPTLRKAQGSEVTILAARDFDFSDVYGLRAR